MSQDQSTEADRDLADSASLPDAVRLVLPATSANLGPGFDAVGLAMAISLTVDAEALPTSGEAMLTIEATGRNAERCSRTHNNMIFEAYRDVLKRSGRVARSLHLRIHNEIPLGMGCGSSAAALLAGVMLANHFGRLGWDLHACMEEACRREGHPDNVAACALGYLTVSAVSGGATGRMADSADSVTAATCGYGLPWKLLLALPSASLATEKARLLLPAAYGRPDVVANIQRIGLLVAAFALGRGELLQVAMQDRIHQPYRMEACPLLPRLLPLAGRSGILGVALSGAGPGVLLVIDGEAAVAEIAARVREAAGDDSLDIIETRAAPGVQQSWTLPFTLLK
jgi:homoserine kinase